MLPKKMEIKDRLTAEGISKETIKKFNALGIAASICKEAKIKATFNFDGVDEEEIKLIAAQKQCVFYEASVVVPYSRCTFIHNGSNITVKSEVKQITL